MKKYTLINQKLVLSDDAKISVQERGFRFGDGVFESCKIYAGKIYDYTSHKERLKLGLEALQIAVDISDLRQNCEKLIAANEIEFGILRIYVSRGIGSMGYLPADDAQALIVAEVMNERKINREKITIGVSEIELFKRPLWLQKCKTAQGLNYILAKIEARKKGFFDCVMLDFQGFVGECSSSNLFFTKDDKIFTPSLNCGILPGVTRKKILENFRVKEVEVRMDELLAADEIFLTNSNFLVLGVDEMEFGGERLEFGKEIGKRVLEFLEEDLIRNAGKY